MPVDGTCYGLRHARATLALSAGIDIKILSERLNRSSTTITREIYTHATPPMQGDAAERVLVSYGNLRRATVSRAFTPRGETEIDVSTTNSTGGFPTVGGRVMGGGQSSIAPTVPRICGAHRSVLPRDYRVGSQ